MPETTKSDAHINAPSELAAVGNPYSNFRGARRDRDFRNWPPSEATADGCDGGLLGAMQRTTTCNDRPKTGRWVALRWRCELHEQFLAIWGLGVNRPEPIMKLLEVADPDVCLLASQYSLIDHENALHHVFPAARAKGVSFVVGSSLNAGFISGSQRYIAEMNARNRP
jgi:hypothetical protein